MELFRGETAQVVALLSTRLTGLFLIAPVFSSKVVPMKVRAALLLLFTFLLLPPAMNALGAGGAASTRVLPATLATEALLGICLGLGAALFIAAAESAGDQLAVQMGLSGANVLDPSTGTQMPVIGHFLGLFVLSLLLSTGGHLVIIDALAASLGAFPPGETVDLSSGLVATVKMLGVQFLLGLRFAAPVVAAMMIGNAALGIMAKTVPQLNVLMMAFPLHIGIGLVTLGLSLPLIASYFGEWPDHYTGVVSEALESFLPPEGRP